MHRTWWLALLSCLLMAAFPDYAHAQTGSSVSDVLCTIIGWFQGPIGRAIAILGVMALGVTTMFGKTQISSLFIVMTGIALIFGAQTILQALSIDAGGTCASANTTLGNIVNNPLQRMLVCTVAIFDSGVGRALGSLAVITLGLFAMYGRISWHQATLVAVGIAAVFGASGLVDALGVNIAGQVVQTSMLAPFACATGTAMGENSLETILCNVLNWFNGPIGKGIATISMIILGLGALFGKVGWDKTIVMGLGIALIFGATGIVDAIGGGSGGTILGMPIGRQHCSAGLLPN